MSEPWLPDPRMIPALRARPRSDDEQSARAPRGAPQSADPDLAKDADTFIRPFIVTGGRTEPLHDGLRVETLIHALPAALSAPLQFERRRIVQLCQVPRSVAEIAAALSVPLGVARVLVADLITSGMVSYQKPTGLPLPLIERILDRVRAL